MNKLLSIVILAFGPILSIANPIDDTCSQHVVKVWGAPQIKVEGDNQYLCRTGYAVNYNNKTKVPYFVVEHLTKAHMVGDEGRKNDFREDPEIPVIHRATLHDYVASGYDRGHMAPAGDFTYDANVMSESFLLSNMMPQDPGNNRGIWKMLEEDARAWTIKHDELYIVSGTIFTADAKHIGANVLIPSEVYKIIIDVKRNKSIAFVFPNVKLEPKDMAKYIVSILDIEAITKIAFFPHLPDKLKNIKIVKGDLSDW